MKPNVVELKVWGRYGLFTDPINKMGGEKFTYQVPTYQALKGVLESCYWKPTITWYIDKVRIMHPIRSQSQGIRPIEYSGGNTLSIYTYLTDVEYQIQAHFEWNLYREELTQDRNENKHHNIAQRSIKCGGRRDVFLGTRECQAYVEPCQFGEGKGYYDDSGEIPLGIMFHGFTYPDENAEGKMVARFEKIKMKEGIIEFCRPEQCAFVRELFKNKPKQFTLQDLTLADDFDWQAEFGGEEHGMDE